MAGSRLIRWHEERVVLVPISLSLFGYGLLVRQSFPVPSPDPSQSAELG